MGTFACTRCQRLNPHTMKVFFFFTSALLALAVSDTCTDCTAVVSTIAARLVSEESIAAQQEILVNGLCTGGVDEEECKVELPGFWAAIAAVLWPGYWDPKADWMCASTCEAPQDVDMTCDDCKMGIQAAIDQLLAPETLDTIVNYLANGDFCANSGDDRCPDIVFTLISIGLPMIAEASDATGFAQACNAAVEGPCPTRKLRLF